MARIAGKSLGSINGLLVNNFSISQRCDPIETTMWGDTHKSYVASMPEITGDLRLLWTDDSNKLSNFILNRFNSSFQHRSLGMGVECQYCHTTWLPGTLKCPSCGGETVDKSSVMEYTNLGTITHYSITNRLDDYMWVNISVLYNSFSWGGWHMGMNTSKMNQFVYHSLLGKPGDWLCPYCGFYTNGEVSKCPGCGGNRLPISKLSDLERRCIYCGQLTRGGFACNKCNQRLTKPWAGIKQ